MFERDDVIAALGPEHLLGGRIGTAGGSFFEHVPPGADVSLLVAVLHNWSDDDCGRILRTCRAAMGPASVLPIGEGILEPDPTRGRPESYFIDIQMMAMFGSARERTRDDFAALPSAAGFELRRIVPTTAAISILEAAPV